MSFEIKVAIATGILIWAVVEDLRTRKFTNRSFLIASAVSLITTLVFGGLSELIPATMGFAAGIVILLPIVLLGIVGAGDMKLVAAVGILTGWNAVLWMVVYGLIWGGVFGVAQVVAKGQGRVLMQNLTSLAVLRTKAGVQVHHIPFTAPLLLGWMTHLVLSGVWT